MVVPYDPCRGKRRLPMGKALQCRRRIDVLLMRFGSNTNALWNDLLERLAASTYSLQRLTTQMSMAGNA